MARKRKKRNFKNKKEKKFFSPALPEETKKWILGALMFLMTIIVGLSFFDKAGVAGQFLRTIIFSLFGKGAFLVPFIFAFIAFYYFVPEPEGAKRRITPKSIGFGAFVLILGVCGFLGTLEIASLYGGWLGYIISQPLLKLFGLLVSRIIFLTGSALSLFIFWQVFSPSSKKDLESEQKVPLIKKIFAPKFKVTRIESETKKVPLSVPSEETSFPEKKLQVAKTEITTKKLDFKPFPIHLLEEDRGKPSSGNIKENSLIVKKTLENFGIEVVMGEANIGPTVTQYTLRPAEGVKLSKIMALSNNLSLALASHPIRIEAPIPGKSLVGIEVPNKVRVTVRLRNLIDNLTPRDINSNLDFILGRDVSGNPVSVDLSRLPHLLVAGSTGTGKTIFLNSLVLSLLYQNGPETLRFILIDPKRVEFPVYNGIPHLLCPVVLNGSQTVNALKWLIAEMERRFDVLSESKTKNIKSYNVNITKKNQDDLKPMPYIVVIIDELADLMAARGRDIEAGIVRLAQMARAVGIHLVVATQRPSVEVITGLIKANITSRISFQVASQIDSRTVLDMKGAEKLLGRGDMLYICAETVKPRRIQGTYASESEVRKVVDYIKSESEKKELEFEEDEELKRTLEEKPDTEKEFEESHKKDPLYEEAKETVVLARKASASLLQRKLQIGYPRAARIIDALEERGVVGSQEGTKPRQVYLKPEGEEEDDDEDQYI